MSASELETQINRFKGNEERLNTFVNVDGFYTTSSGVQVPTLLNVSKRIEASVENVSLAEQSASIEITRQTNLVIAASTSAQEEFLNEDSKINTLAKNTIADWQTAITTITQTEGVPALAVSTANNETQQEINDSVGAKWYAKGGGYPINSRVMLENGDIVKSTVDGNVNNPNVDMTGWVKSNSASQIFDKSGLSQQDVNNNFDHKTYFIITPEMFGAKGFPNDDTAALQAALDFISPTQWDTSVAVMNQKGGGGKLVLPRRYRITDTLWVGAYTSIDGLGALGFNSSLLENVSAIVTDFTDPLKPAISSSNWKQGGVRVAYDEQTTGAMYDNGLVSATHGIKASGFSLLTKSGTRCYMGFRLQNSPQSDINIYANGFDYGIMSNASWDSRINSRCLSYKCGLLLNFDSNNLVFDGYYNALDGDVISGSTNLLTFFTPDTETDITLNGDNIKFGAVNRYSFGASCNSLIAEHNDVGCVVCNGAANFQTLYTEANRIAGFVSFTSYSKTIIGNFVGHSDASACILGANSQLEIVASNKTGTAQGDYFKRVSVWNSDITVPRTLNEYAQGIRYAGYDHILYVSSSGNDLNSGIVDNFPLATIDEAISRITKLSRFSNSNLKLDNRIRAQVVLLTDGDFVINVRHILHCDMDIVSVASSAPTLKFNGGYLTLNNTRVSVVNCNVLKDATIGTVENAAFWTINGSNTVSIRGGNTNIQAGGLIYCEYNGASDVTLTLNYVDVIGTANSQLVQGNYLNTSPHIVSVVRSHGSISADITGRSDKGVSVPVAWQNKILGI